MHKSPKPNIVLEGKGREGKGEGGLEGERGKEKRKGKGEEKGERKEGKQSETRFLGPTMIKELFVEK